MATGGSFIERVAAMRSLAASLVAEADAILAAVDRTWAPGDDADGTDEMTRGGVL